MNYFRRAPQLAEFNTPRSMDAAGECPAYDGFKACKILVPHNLLYFMFEFQSTNLRKSKANNETSGSVSQTRNTFA
jgi:hypothetical protein